MQDTLLLNVFELLQCQCLIKMIRRLFGAIVVNVIWEAAHWPNPVKNNLENRSSKTKVIWLQNVGIFLHKMFIIFWVLSANFITFHIQNDLALWANYLNLIWHCFSYYTNCTSNKSSRCISSGNFKFKRTCTRTIP